MQYFHHKNELWNSYYLENTEVHIYICTHISIYIFILTESNTSLRINKIYYPFNLSTLQVCSYYSQFIKLIGNLFSINLGFLQVSHL